MQPILKYSGCKLLSTAILIFVTGLLTAQSPRLEIDSLAEVRFTLYAAARSLNEPCLLLISPEYTDTLPLTQDSSGTFRLLRSSIGGDIGGNCQQSAEANLLARVDGHGSANTEITWRTRCDAELNCIDPPTCFDVYGHARALTHFLLDLKVSGLPPGTAGIIHCEMEQITTVNCESEMMVEDSAEASHQIYLLNALVDSGSLKVHNVMHQDIHTGPTFFSIIAHNGDNIRLEVASTTKVGIEDPPAMHPLGFLEEIATGESYGTLKLQIQTVSTLSGEQHAKSISVFPTVANEQVHLSWTAAENGTAWLRIFGSAGQLVQEKGIENVQQGANLQAIDVSRLPAGLYTIQLKDGRQGFYTGRFIK